MAGLYVLGGLVFDAAVRAVETLPSWGAAANVDSISFTVGGNGSATACAAAKLGSAVRLAGAVGEDPAGRFVLDGVRECGVDTTLVRRSQSATAKTVVLIHPGGERLFLQELAATADISVDDLSFEDSAVDGCAWFHFASPHCLTSLRPYAAETLERARAAGLRTSMDLDWDPLEEWFDFLEPVLPLLDLLFLNRDEARHETSLDDPEAAARLLRAGGAGAVAVKLGAAGCGVLAGEQWLTQAAPRADAIDTTGAGDCFCGAYLHALLAGQGHAGCARFATAAASLSVSKQGNVDSQPTRAAVEASLRRSM